MSIWDDLSKQAQDEQSKAAMAQSFKDWSKTLFQFYSALIAEGFRDDQALQFCVTWHNSILKPGEHK